MSRINKKGASMALSKTVKVVIVMVIFVVISFISFPAVGQVKDIIIEKGVSILGQIEDTTKITGGPDDTAYESEKKQFDEIKSYFKKIDETKGTNCVLDIEPPVLSTGLSKAEIYILTNDGKPVGYLNAPGASIINMPMYEFKNKKGAFNHFSRMSAVGSYDYDSYLEGLFSNFREKLNAYNSINAYDRSGQQIEQIINRNRIVKIYENGAPLTYDELVLDPSKIYMLDNYVGVLNKDFSFGSTPKCGTN